MSAHTVFRSSALALALAASLLLTGCGEDAAVSFVKNMPYPYDKAHTTAQVLENYRYCTDIEWTSDEDEKGGRTVLFACSLRHFDNVDEIAEKYFQKRLADAEASLDPESEAYQKFLDGEKRRRDTVRLHAATRAKSGLQFKPLSNGKSYYDLERAYDRAESELKRINMRIENHQANIDRLSARENPSRTTLTMIKQAERLLGKAQAQLPAAQARFDEAKSALDAAQGEYDAKLENLRKDLLAEFDKESQERLKAFQATAEKKVARAKEDAEAPRPWVEIERSQFRFAFAMEGENRAKPQSATIRITYKDGKTADVPMGDMSLRGILSDDPIGVGTPDKGDILLSVRALFDYYGLARSSLQ